MMKCLIIPNDIEWALLLVRKSIVTPDSVTKASDARKKFHDEGIVCPDKPFRELLFSFNRRKAKVDASE